MAKLSGCLLDAIFQAQSSEVEVEVEKRQEHSASRQNFSSPPGLSFCFFRIFSKEPTQRARVELDSFDAFF